MRVNTCWAGEVLRVFWILVRGTLSPMQQEGESGLKNWGTYAVGLIVIIVGFLALGVFLGGMVWASAKVLPWLETASRIAFDVCVFVLVPLCIFSKNTPVGGGGLCLRLALVWRDALRVLLPLCFFCVGARRAGNWADYRWRWGCAYGSSSCTVPHAQWAVLLDLVFGIALTFGTRWLGRRLTEVHAQDELASQRS